MKPLSRRMDRIGASKTLEINAKANALRAQGVRVINFSSGEPDFKTPAHVLKKAKTFLEGGHVRYTAAAGIAPLLEAVVDKFSKDNGLMYEAKNIIVTSGAKYALYNALQVLCDEGDEVLIPSPYWTSYPEMVRLAGASPVFVDTDRRFSLVPDALEAAMTTKTKAIIINSPNNPSGAVHDKETLEAIAALAIRHDLYVISDEIYEKLIYEGGHVSIASLSEAIKARTIVVNGVSKAYAMTGWRIGYAAAPEAIAKRMINMQSHATSNANTVAQHAALEALRGDPVVVEDMRHAFARRKDVMVEGLNAIGHLVCDPPAGAFYAMPDVSALFGKTFKDTPIETASDVSRLLLEEAHVATVPGEAFGTDQHVRLSYATSLEDIEEGLQRIAAVVKAMA